VINFDDVLIADDAPWDPTALLGKFESPWVVVISQIFMIIATLSTNIAANVIAPSNAFSNLWPKKISFRTGGIITGIIGILIMPWWLMDSISGMLILVSGFLGPVLGIMLCDYFIIRKKNLQLKDLYLKKGIYSYGFLGVNWRAIISLGIGIHYALIWHIIPGLSFLSNLAWFSGFIASFVAYFLLMRWSAHYKLINQ
ncbi:MAG: cytosine permease, partial [Flavobacteriales bacterium]|nr:cytosine permease [Flavobacteriales bacterium]